MSTDYTNVNGYLIPSFALPTGSTPPLGKYGAMRARFLDEHRPFERDQMLLDGTAGTAPCRRRQRGAQSGQCAGAPACRTVWHHRGSETASPSGMGGADASFAGASRGNRVL